jgi:hypothetical protein
VFHHLREKARETTITHVEYEVLSSNLCTGICEFDFFVSFASIWTCPRFRKIWCLPVSTCYDIVFHSDNWT